MKEKLKLTSRNVKREGESNGKPWTIYEYGGEGTTMFDSFQKVEVPGEYEVERTEPNNPLHNPQIKFILPKKGGSFQKDWGFEKRKAALQCAVTLVSSGVVKADKLIETRDKFFTYLDGK